MNKEELLQELSRSIDAGDISREDVLAKLNSVAPLAQETDSEKEEKSPRFSITKILYILGAAIVIVGIVAFVSQIWDDVGSMGRVSVTLGLGLLLAGIGSMLFKQKPGNTIGPVFHLIGGVLIPGGAAVALSELDVTGAWAVTLTFASIFVFYILLDSIHKHALLTFFAIINGTATVYLALGAIIDGSPGLYVGIDEIYQYLTIAVGSSYLLLAHSFREGWNKRLVGVLHFFGIVGILGAAFSQVFDSVTWQMLYFLVVIGGFLLSVYMHSRSILLVSVIFLVAHFSFITSEYFADSIGWPISLVILGFVFIGLAYASITINKKYIANS